MVGEDIVHHGPVGVDELCGGFVLGEELSNVLDGFRSHGGFEVTTEAEILVLDVGHGEGDGLADDEPLGDEGVEEVSGFG